MQSRNWLKNNCAPTFPEHRKINLLITFLCLRFRASLIYIHNCPTRCNTKQSLYYSASSLFMFWVSTTPIIRGIQNCNYSLRYSNVAKLAWPRWRETAAQKIWPVPEAGAWPRWRETAAQKIWPVREAVVTVLYTPDDGCCWHPKHEEWTCRITKRLLCVASRWTIISIVDYFWMRAEFKLI